MLISLRERNKPVDIDSAADCDFCREFASCPSGAGPLNRVVFANDSFVIVPSLGALHPSHILICTRRHATGLHELSVDETDRLAAIYSRIERAFTALHGEGLVAFENGTERGSPSGCSVVHFHLHVVPVARKLEYSNISTLRELRTFDGLREAAKYAASLRNYLLLKTPAWPFAVLRRDGFGTQYMRKVVAELNGRSEWDWRSTEAPRDWALVRSGLQPYVTALHNEIDHDG